MNKFNLPNLGYGIGLRTVHYPYIMSEWPELDFFEIISENYMDTDGRPKRKLEEISARYPIIMHGVSMGLGSVDSHNSEYLRKLKELVDWVNPIWVSDHLCWTGVAHKNLHDLLPIPYTEESLKHIVQKIKEVQDFLERPLLIENPSTYMEFIDSTIPESEFFGRMAVEADCGLLVDVNNIYVSCYNHKLDPKEYMDNVPGEHVVQVHLAGHQNNGNHIIDTHDREVIDEVWTMYRYLISKTGPVSTMVEWDGNIPEFEVVKAEVEKARKLVDNLQIPNELPDLKQDRGIQPEPRLTPLETSITHLRDAILEGDLEKAKASEWISAKPDFSPDEQLDAYFKNYRYRLFDVAEEEYPVLRRYLGDELMNQLMWEYIEDHVSSHFNIGRYITAFPEFIKKAKCLLDNGKINHDFACELAELETEISQIFDMRETPALRREVLKDISPEEMLEMQLPLRDAAKLFTFKHQVNKYYSDVMNEENPSNKIVEENTYLAVFRNEDKIWRLPLDGLEYDLLKLLADGKTLEESLEVLTEDNEAEIEAIIANMEKWSGRWISGGLLAEAA